MEAKFICHPDFENENPINVFHKQVENVDIPVGDPKFSNRHILFRKKIELTDIRNAILRISADDYYKLYINGNFVTQGPAPSYPQHYYYNELDVSEYLCEGENTFAIHTYYQGLINRVWVSADHRQMLWLSLDVNGENVLVSDESWLCTNHSGYTACGKSPVNTFYLECYDSSSSEEGFFLPDYDDGAWENATVFQNADYTLEKQPTPQLYFETLSPKTVEHFEGGIRVDFGREAVGYIRLVAKGNRGDCITIRCGEELNDDGSVRYKMRCDTVYEEKWLLSGNVDTLRQFDYKAFRYAEFLFPEGVDIKEIAFDIRYMPFEQKATYTTDNEELKKVVDLCVDTIKYGTQEVFVDCPTREKGQYLGDVTIEARGHAVVTGDLSMMKKAIRNFCNSAFICPGIMAVSTSSLMQEIADYSLQFPAQILWVYSIEKDIDFLKETEPYLTGAYKYFLDYADESGLIQGVVEKWNLVDWPKNLRDGYDFPLTTPIGPGVHNVLNAFWCGFLEALDEIYSILGMNKTGMTEKVKQSFIDTFYCKETGLFCDSVEHTHSSIHSNILPLLFDIGTEDMALRDRLIDFLMEKKLTAMGVYMAYFALAALKKHGKDKEAELLAVDNGCWLNMLSEGATTTYEAWGKDQKWNTSLFHPWATAPAIVFADGVNIY